MRTLTGTILVGFMACAAVWAQGGATAQIHGTVQDSTGAAVPGAEVKATQTATGLTRTATSGNDGGYVLSNLAIGPYQVEVSKAGFTKYVQSGIVLQVDSDPAVEVALKVGSVNDQVLVQADASLVETQSVGIGQTVNNEEILELPLNGRQVTDLITLNGGAVLESATRSNNWPGGEPLISVSGGLGFGVDYQLDGANHLNFMNLTPMPVPFPDALQEFKVETNGLAAQHGRGTSVNMVTKSGTNEIHGDLFEFLRNDALSARNYFAAPGNSLKRNQFGGTVGGPIKKNKLFFFVGYQGTILRQNTQNLQAFIPTPAMMTGDFTTFTSPACNAGRQINLGAPFVGNKINPAQFNPVSMYILGKLNQIPSNPCGLVTYGSPNDTSDHQAVTRFDYQLSDKHSMFVRYVIDKSQVAVPYAVAQNNLLDSTSTGYNALANSFTFGDTYLISPNTVNSFRMGVNRVVDLPLGPRMFDLCQAGSNFYCGYAPGIFSMSVTGGFSIGTRFTPNEDQWINTSYQLSDDVSIVHGAHQMAFGGQLVQGRNNEVYWYYAIPTLTFDGSATGQGMADFFTGQVATLATGAPTDVTLHQWVVGFYANDTWKLTPRLTVNYGVRWEPYIPQNMVHNIIDSFDYTRFLNGVHSKVYPSAPAGFYYPGDPGFVGNSGSNKRWDDFGPRLGLAWDPRGNGRTSIRSSFSFGYDYVSALWREDPSAAAPWTDFTNLTGVPLSSPWTNFPGGNPFPLPPGGKFTPYSNFQSIPVNVKPPNTAAWNLNLEQQIGTNWLASAAYLGSEVSHIWTQTPFNPAVFLGLGACTINGVSYTTCSTIANTNQRRLLGLERPADGQLIGALGIVDPGGTMSYNGMLLSVQRRASHGLALSANYTWSHCIGNYADLISGGPDANETYTIPNNRNADRGNCNTDRRQNFNLTAVATTPRFENAVLRAVATGWGFSPILRIMSGQPFTVTTGSDKALSGINNQRVNQVATDPYSTTTGGGPLSFYLNAAAFAQPAPGTTGNMGFNALTGLGFWELDASLTRSFRVTEHQRLELRGEAFNLTNSFRSAFAVGTGDENAVTLSGNTFGQIRAAQSARVTEFALKYFF